MKKIIGIIIVIALMAVGGVGVYFAVKSNTTSLKVDMHDMTIVKGETELITYSCNFDDATVTFEVGDESIVKIVEHDNKFYAEGLKVGDTTIKIVARYNKYRNYHTADVHVVASDDGDETEISYNITPNDGCEVSGHTISMTAGDTASLVISPNNATDEITSSSLSCEDANVRITKKTIPANTYTIKCDVAGTYILVVSVNGHIESYTLIVE